MVEGVYENTDKLTENCKGEKNLILMGDCNTVVGEAKVNNIQMPMGWEKKSINIILFKI